MITTKGKLAATGVMLFILLLCAGFQLFSEVELTNEKITSASEMDSKTLGGVIAKMPDASAKIFFESLMGVKLNGYESYGTPDAAIMALKNHQVHAIWASDVTADYLLKTNEGLDIVTFQNPMEERLQFAFALQKKDQALCDKINVALDELRLNGRLDELIVQYIETEDTSATFYEKDMLVRSKEYSDQVNGTIYVGVSGAVPPLDQIDEEGEPVGFSVALMDELGLRMGKKVKFVVLNNETIFTELMAGRIDMVFCYGSSKNHSTEQPIYMMSDGYYPMSEYVLVVNQ